MSILFLNNEKTEFVLTLSDVEYHVYSRKRITNGYTSYSTTEATLATNKTFILKSPKIYHNHSRSDFYMNKPYPHAVFLKTYAKKIKGQHFGLMCLGSTTKNNAYRLVRSQKFDELKYLMEDRLTTASLEDSYINFRSIDFNEENLTTCRLCGLYITKNNPNNTCVNNRYICSGCISKMRYIHGNIDLRAIKHCRTCGMYSYKFGKCKSSVCRDV